MPLSVYTKTYPENDNADSIILFSTKKASIITAPVQLLQDIELDRISGEERMVLSELGFLVDDRESEKAGMRSFFTEIDELNTIFKAYIVLNLDCNLACRYCFEGTRKGKHFMTRETADQLVEYAGNHMAAKSGEIQFVFYGGEPLLSMDLIIYIAQKIRNEVRQPFSFTLITNGVLLTRDKVKRLRPLGLKDASVTLDGPREVHDIYRPFRNGKGSFDIIFRNVKDVSDLLKIQVGGNFSQDSYPEFPRLLDFFIDNHLTPEKVSDVRFDFITKETAAFAQPDFHEGVASMAEPWLHSAIISLREEILRRGYRAQKITPVSCMMEYSERMIINYNGDIYKCPGLIGRQEYKIGDLMKGIQDYSKSHNLDNWKNEECLACEYLPLCFGGCRYMKLVRDGNMDGVDCKKQYFDATLEALVKQDIKYRLIN